MGFLNWFEKHPEEETSTGTQLSLLGDSQELVERQRVDGAVVRKRYTQTIKEKGGNNRTYSFATEILTEEVMGCATKELYQKTGAKKGHRETLPILAQEVLMGAEIIANQDLKQKTIEGTQAERDRQIIEAARKSGTKWRKLLPW